MRLRSTWEVRMETSLPSTKPQWGLWEAPCEKEASLDLFLPLTAAGEKHQGRGTRLAAPGAQDSLTVLLPTPAQIPPALPGSHHPHLGTVRAGTARVPQCPAAEGSASLLAGPQSGPHHVPQSPETPHSPSGPELRPVTGDSLSWVPSCQLRAHPLQRRKQKSWPGEDWGLPHWVRPNWWPPVTPGRNCPQQGSLEHQHCPQHWEEIPVEEILDQTLQKKDNKTWRVKKFYSNPISSDNCKNEKFVTFMRKLEISRLTGYLMNLGNYC